MSSRYFAAAAIMARAESLTDEGACPSAQLIEASALAFDDALRDHFQKLMWHLDMKKGRCRGPRGWDSRLRFQVSERSASEQARRAGA